MYFTHYLYLRIPNVHKSIMKLLAFLAYYDVLETYVFLTVRYQIVCFNLRIFSLLKTSNIQGLTIFDNYYLRFICISI